MNETPTNKQIRLEGTSIYYLKQGRIFKDSVVVDNLGFLTQLGIIDGVSMVAKTE